MSLLLLLLLPPSLCPSVENNLSEPVHIRSSLGFCHMRSLKVNMKPLASLDRNLDANFFG